MHRMQRNTGLRLALREIHRIKAVAYQFAADFTDEEVRYALEGMPSGSMPSMWEVLCTWRKSQCQRRPYGVAYRIRVYPFFSSAPVPFLAVLLPKGNVAVSFPPRDRPDLSPLVTRFALNRVFQAHHWRFPEDLGQQEIFTAAWEVIWALPPPFALAPGMKPQLLVWGSDTNGCGQVDLMGTWVINGLPGCVQLHWTPLRLDVRMHMRKPAEAVK